MESILMFNPLGNALNELPESFMSCLDSDTTAGKYNVPELKQDMGTFKKIILYNLYVQ
jgi:hypothetical protein